MVQPTDLTAAQATKLGAGRELRVRVGRHVDRSVAAIVQAYAAAWQQTRDELLQAIADAEAGAALTGQQGVAAYRTARLQAALDELTLSLQQLGQQSGVIVTGAVAATVQAPGLVLESLGRLTGREPAALSSRALASMVQRASGAIASDYLQLSDDAERAMREALVQGVTQGKGPRDVAATMVDKARAAAAAKYGLLPEQVDDLRRAGMAEHIVGAVDQAFAGGQARALNLARTELIDTSRAATTASYVASGMVVGWRWLCSLDPRSCPACWGMHNTVHPVTEHQLGHQQCRCTQVPVLAGEELADSDMGDPDELLRKTLRSGTRQDRDLLRLSFGEDRLRHIAGGGSVRDLVVLTDNPGWRPAYVVKPVRDLTV